MAWATTSRQSRGYGRAWELLREVILKRDNGLCQCRHCKATGRVTLATEVDHVISKAAAQTKRWTQAQIDHPSNLQAIARECHKRKTIEEAGGEFKPRARIGVDGYPVG